MESVKNQGVTGLHVGDASKINKGTPIPNRDVPAKTALARIFTTINRIVQAYDRLNSTKEATGMTAEARSIDRANAPTQLGNKADDDGVNMVQRQNFIRIVVTNPAATDRTTATIKSGQQQIEVTNPVLDAGQQL
ncbi:hypothetical protein A4A49_44310 [Nicotiana attenuata]|uniref:Uncharacterized protein n=1 Tax=Nicotiana attenuata TaxID=49451 RepID=A0A314KL52_NICAT|nr:hypothetical protein A4A49_44310 [Nicotiana attenuata]